MGTSIEMSESKLNINETKTTMITTNNTENIGSIKRKICGQWFIDFPKDVEPTSLKVYAYDLGNRKKVYKGFRIK